MWYRRAIHLLVPSDCHIRSCAIESALAIVGRAHQCRDVGELEHVCVDGVARLMGVLY